MDPTIDELVLNIIIPGCTVVTVDTNYFRHMIEAKLT